jgi:hypothetical protein
MPVIRKQKFKITISRETEVELPGEEKESCNYEMTSVTKEGTRMFGYVTRPPLATRVIQEHMTLLEQELDVLNFELVVRAINFPGDFGPLSGTAKEGQ